MANEKITKSFLASAMGISRSTLDKYLKEGFPKKDNMESINKLRKVELGRRKLEIENEIRLHNYDLEELKKELLLVEEDLKNFNDNSSEIAGICK